MHRHYGGIEKMLLSPKMPHGGRDEQDYIEALETVRVNLTEGKKAGAVDFFICGDLNIEFRLDNADDVLHGLDSIEWYGPSVEEAVRIRSPRRKTELVTAFERF